MNDESVESTDHLDLTEIETDYEAIFASYREYVNLCMEVLEEPPNLSEFRKVA